MNTKTAIDARAEHVLQRLREALPRLAMEFGVTGAGLFGSVARGDARPESDVDILVELGRPLDYFGLARLERRLSDLLGQEADVVPRADVRPTILAEIEKDLIPA